MSKERTVEANAQNSEHKASPSSARIEKIIEDTNPERKEERKTEARSSGPNEIFRPSECESPILDGYEVRSHRTDPEHRES